MIQAHSQGKTVTPKKGKAEAEMSLTAALASCKDSFVLGVCCIIHLFVECLRLPTGGEGWKGLDTKTDGSVEFVSPLTPVTCRKRQD